MKRTINTLLGVVCLAVGLLGSQTAALAVPLTGGIGFAGAATPQTSAGTTTFNLSLATQISFATGLVFVTSGSGSFSGLVPGSTVTMAPLLKFIAPQNVPIAAFYKVGAFTFDLSTISVIDQSSTLLDLRGTGIFHAAGFTDTPGTYLASFNVTSGNFGFFASSGTVPDGGSTVALLGLSLVAVVGIRRLLNKQPAPSFL